MSFELRPYQNELYTKIQDSKSLRNCVQAPTGAGKTILFSHLANTYDGRVLILVNRTELVEQTAKNINRDLSFITAKTKEVSINSVMIGMVESVHNRIKKGVFSLDDIDVIIVDEIQNLQFIKVFENYKKRLIGFTATPIILKKETYFKCRYCENHFEEKTTCCGKETQKYNSTISLKRYYGELIPGPKIEYLISIGKLTPVHNLVCSKTDLSPLKTDSSGEYTSKSVDETFNNLASVNNLVANYEAHCFGKKTMVFNANIEANFEAYKKFKELGYNVRYYDSKTKENRSEVVDWFRNDKDAILMSVGVFTTGFDVDDVEVIMLNKATKSLSLYHQIVGRGGRPTDKIYKPFFLCVDLGGNISEHGSWSDTVDWEEIYNNEVVKKSQINDLEDFKVCHSCDAMIKVFPCEFCGAIEPEKKKRKGEIVIAEEINKLPPPNAEHILNYCLKNELDINEAKKLTANYICDMFIFARTKKETLNDKASYLKNRIKQMVRPIYFKLHGSDLKGNRIRTMVDFENKIYTKIRKHYE